MILNWVKKYYNSHVLRRYSCLSLLASNDFYIE